MTSSFGFLRLLRSIDSRSLSVIRLSTFESFDKYPWHKHKPVNVHETQQSQQSGQDLRGDVKIGQLRHILKMEPALVTEQGYADVSEENPEDETHEKRSNCWFFVYGVREDSRACSAYVAHRVQPRDQKARSYEILEDHSAIKR